DAAEAVAGIERLELQVSIRGHANYARHLDRDDGTGICHFPWHWRGIIRALQIHSRVGKVVSKVALRRHYDGAVLHSETDRTPFGFPDRALDWIVLAVHIPWIGKVTVVRDVHVMGASPHERADDRLRKEKAIGITRFDTRDANIGRDSDNTDRVLGGGNRARGVCAMTVVIVRRDLALYRRARQAVHASSVIHIRCEIGMRVIE